MYLKRKVDVFLEEWKADKNRKPLIVKGSRQIGKTESILHFAANHYENVIEINFVRDEKYKGIIADGYEAADIIKNISLIDPTKKFVPEKTLIFFDEITEFPEIATSLKFFCIDGRFDVICSGSMLGVNYKRIESNSVGYKKDYEIVGETQPYRIIITQIPLQAITDRCHYAPEINNLPQQISRYRIHTIYFQPVQSPIMAFTIYPIIKQSHQ